MQNGAETHPLNLILHLSRRKDGSRSEKLLAVYDLKGGKVMRFLTKSLLMNCLKPKSCEVMT